MLRSGARSLLARAVEAEVAAFLDGHSEARTEEGRRRLVRHGHLPEREIMTGIGPVAVRAPRVRDRTGLGADRIRFSSALLPPYARRSKSLEVLIPVLYLKGISTGDFAEALAALLGPDAGGLSASTVARLTEVWADQHAHWLKRDPRAPRLLVSGGDHGLGAPASSDLATVEHAPVVRMRRSGFARSPPRQRCPKPPSSRLSQTPPETPKVLAPSTG